MNEIVGHGGAPKSLPLATLKGTPIPNERRRELLPERQRAAVELWRQLRPAAKLRSATAVYNCVGLVFASRRTWIEPEHVPLILREDEYYCLDGPDKVVPGDVLVYRNTQREIKHIGIVIERNPQIETASWKIRILSQWGADGEYIHDADHVPEDYGKPSEYWSERRTMP